MDSNTPGGERKACLTASFPAGLAESRFLSAVPSGKLQPNDLPQANGPTFYRIRLFGISGPAVINFCDASLGVVQHFAHDDAIHAKRAHVCCSGTPRIFDLPRL